MTDRAPTICSITYRNNLAPPLKYALNYDNQRSVAVTDMYVYYFMHRPAGEEILSERRATLEAIKGNGEAVMESQIVVDHTEVDGNGFLIGGIDTESHPMDELWPQIRSR